MARPPRIEYPGALDHATSRGDAGADIVHDGADRSFRPVVAFMRLGALTLRLVE